MIAASAAFPGFPPAAFRFFEGLRDHNDPVWFKPRKAVYETEVLAPFRHLIVAVGAALEEAGLPLAGDPRRGIFRIYRDVRFSPDKPLPDALVRKLVTARINAIESGATGYGKKGKRKEENGHG